MMSSKRRSTDSPSQRHKQHLLTKDQPLLTRLSMVSIPSHAASHKKKDTLLGMFTHYILSQGKSSVREPYKNK